MIRCGTTRSIRLMMLLLGAALVTLALVPGCGYTTKQVFPEQVQSIYLPIFQNRSFYRGVEFDLTEALAKEIELRTPYKIAQQGAADSTLTGTIVNVEQTRLSRTRPGGLPQEMEVRVVVDLDWKDGRTGKIIRQRRGLTAAGRYIPVRQVGEQYQTGQHEAVDRMAQEIVAAMRGDW